MHEYHECLEAKAVWAKVASDWLEATGNVLDVSSPLLTVTGLRLPAPGSLSAEARARFDALEPAWRLVHSVALLKLHQARTRAHMAYHAEPQRQPKKTSTRDVMRAVKQRVLQRVEFEYSKAKHAATFSRDPRPLSRFFATWIATGVVAAIHKGQPRLRLFSAPQPETLPSPGTLHIRTCGAYVKTRGKRGPGSGFSLTAHEVQADGTETLVLTASGAVPAVATHGAKAPPLAASQHTPQVAQHAAALAGLACAEHALANGWNVRATLGSETTHRSIERRADRKSTTMRRSKHDSLNSQVRKKVTRMRADYAQTLELRAPSRATPLSLLAAAGKAAFLPSLHAKVTTHAAPPHSALWGGSRIWDPGD